MGQAFKQCRIWSSRQAEFTNALNRKGLVSWQSLLSRALKIDLMIKGIRPVLNGEEVWLEMSQLVLKMAQKAE
jgi:DNA polymerase-3 subunit delta